MLTLAEKFGIYLVEFIQLNNIFENKFQLNEDYAYA